MAAITDTDTESAGIWHPLDGIDPATAAFPVEAELDGVPILVFKTANGFRGTAPLCPHQQASLKTAKLMNNDAMIRCARHNFVFRLDTGAGVNCTGMTLKTYDIREKNGRLEGAAPISGG